MDTHQLEAILRHDPYTERYFLGVFAADHLPKTYTQPCCYIANIDSSDKPGSHWVCVFAEKGRVEFFDSYGGQPRQYRLPISATVWNKERLQHPESDTCGLHCLFVLMHRCRGLPFTYILNYLYQSKDLLLNECMVLTDVMSHVLECKK